MKTKLFISYAWESDQGKDKKIKHFVHWLGTYLQKWNFDVQLDKFENHPGTNLQKFMQQGIDTSKIVLCVCTETYLEKINQEGTGVNTEIVRLKAKGKGNFIIPLVDMEKFPQLPPLFADQFVSELNFANPASPLNQEGLFELISTLSDQLLDHSKVAVKARIDGYYNDVEKFKIYADVVRTMSFDEELSGKVTFEYLRNNGTFEIGFAQEAFVTGWSTAGSETIYSYRKDAELFEIQDFDEFESIESPADINHANLSPITWSVAVKKGDGLVWINKFSRMAIGRILDIHIDPDNELKSTVTLQYKALHLINVHDAERYSED
jgi:hypothetical protein